MNENEALVILRVEKEHFPDVSIFGESLLLAIKALEEIQQYRSIGTPDECRAAMEKQRAKKPREEYDGHMDYYCPCCDKLIFSLFDDGGYDGYKRKRCLICGQAIDWSDAE